MNYKKVFTSAVAATALAAGMVACSDGEGVDSTATTAAESASGTATVTNIETATEAAETETATETDGAEGSAEAVSLSTADGQEVKVPTGLVQAIGQYAESDWGEPMKVTEHDGSWIVDFDNDHHVAWNENTGGAPIWGQIANVWLTQEGVMDEVGFPTEAETPLPNESGWFQEFERGTIEWTRENNDTGAFAANIIEK
ncbi:hypothetical protein BJP08_07215 [Corynebacterium sp. NML140438]|uniref:LGFP repeat-containing protein n=1 Tax=Corynebacterium sp. NML140438 TaxID=1906334 RepID=UPI0008FAF5BE|nr:hypothetical protein [Corynebacterium sp. NML140438]OIR41534.1 hypothetical protein BJP08_07215 [Corynebacterium sp. NML140438]